MIIMRLRTGHCRLRHLLFTKFQTGQSAETWSADTPFKEKLYGPLPDLLHTAAFIRVTDVAVCGNDKEKEEIDGSS